MSFNGVVVRDALMRDLREGALSVSFLETSSEVLCWLRMWNGYVVCGRSWNDGKGQSVALLNAVQEGVRFEEFKYLVGEWCKGLGKVWEDKGVRYPSLLKGGVGKEFLPALEFLRKNCTAIDLSGLRLLGAPELNVMLGGVVSCSVNLECGYPVVGCSSGLNRVLECEEFELSARAEAYAAVLARVFELEGYLVCENRMGMARKCV